VPEKRQELTTEGGLDVVNHLARIQQIVSLLHDGNIPVSLFIEPDLAQVKTAHKVSADFVELHTGRYANAQRSKEADAEVDAITQAAKLAYKLGIGVNAGHGLNYRNVQRLLRIPEIVEYNIGHSIVARAVLVGLDQAVREMKALLG
jgi:pyridoxine 5-phosphate synthase